jgi:putative PIN family toxin of toxin-antitoxin system
VAAPELRAVLDTNVVVSAALKPHSLPAAIVSAATAQLFTLCLSDAIRDEYQHVLTRGKFGFTPDLVSRFLSELEATARKVTPPERLAITRDSEDNKFLECAVEANASYLVTGNTRHFPYQFRTIRVVTPREFFALLLERLAP